ncbi:MAG: cryptochrome/photolyase family protein [Flavobacteriaceae bacterium]|nr:cryptochrome/photolyase family protein [Flavobacteriaceae bacterium]
MKTLRLILGDQLNIDHSWFDHQEENIIYCLFETRQDTDFIRHHIQKLCAFFGAMRQFADELRSRGHRVFYFKINDIENRQTLTDNLNHLIEALEIEKFEYLFPDKFGLDKRLKAFCDYLSIPSRASDTEHFITERRELKDFFDGKKQFIMESFYRHLRKKHDILMEAGQPEGGLWNYDKSNRKKWKSHHTVPVEISFNNDVSEILADLKDADVITMGRPKGQTIDYPLTRSQAIDQLDYFCEHLLVHFGDYQDAMHTGEVNLFHSRISFALNTKILDPRTCINSAIKAFRTHRETISISQLEGFVRQILGWREYMRGMYWMFMPNYKTTNELGHHNTLPNFYWTGKTKMNCMSHAINNSLDNAYAHHIQRLMITGNFALLNQTDPDQVDAWYLGIYADALEWVQITNTRGMSQFADGGKIATKPYISAANYINKMSNYCGDCNYNNKERHTDNACPFNSLYWNFLDDKREKLASNRRMGMVYKLLDRIPKTELEKIKDRAYQIIMNPDDY